MCKYTNDFTGYKCPHDSLEDSDYCIFHLQDDNKNVAEFNEAINNILAEKDSIDFTGFYFPPDAGNFKNVTFKGDTKFSNAKFEGTVDFSNVKFGGTADFRYAKFEEEVTFFDVVINGYALFSDVIFSRKVNFTAATFNENAEFTNAEFNGDAIFINVTFENNAKFKLSQFKERFKLVSKKNSEIEFTDVLFSDNVRIIADLSKCSFANSNIERVDMTNSIWIEDKGNMIIIYEDKANKKLDDLKKLEGIYRRLKQSYQKYGDSDTAGKFYYQEMECKRNQMNYFPKHFWNIFYNKLCGYGEKPYNVIWASLGIIIVASFLYFYFGIEYLGTELAPAKLIAYDSNLSYCSILKDFLFCVYTSVITFTTLGYGDVHPIGWSRLIASIESGVGVFMTALFIFVFTRKMLR